MKKVLEVIKKEIEKEVQEQFKLNEKETIDYCPECNVAYCQGRYTTGQCE